MFRKPTQSLETPHFPVSCGSKHFPKHFSTALHNVLRVSGVQLREKKPSLKLVEFQGCRGAKLHRDVADEVSDQKSVQNW